MKRIILTLVVFLMFCGVASSQDLHWPYSNAWNNNQIPSSSTSIVGRVYLDGEVLNSNDYEIAAFVDDVCRGSALLKSFPQMPTIYWAWFAIRYNDNEVGKTAVFKLYRHSTDTEYTICSNLLVLGNETEGTPDEPYIINFYNPFTKVITPYTENGGYYLIASPIGSVNPEEVGQMLTNNYDLYYFDQTQDKEWVNYKTGGEVNTNPGFSLEPGKGYLYANSENVTLTFSGAPYNDNQPIPLTKTQGAQFEGWNLIGNPYATAATVSVESFYRMNPEGRADLIEGSDLVDAMEGIFVIAESDDDEVTFTPGTSSKSFEQIAINLLKNRGNVIDRAVVRFGECRQLPKFQLNPRNTKIYVTEGDKDYAVVRSAAEAEMPVSFRASENGTYTLAVEAENVEMNYLHLIDNLTGMDVDLLQTPGYTFQAKTTDYASRFKLVFAIDRTNDESFAFFNNDNWFINNDGKALLQVIDLNGRLLSNEQISGSVSKHIDAAPGVYVMRLINGDNVKTQKVVVR